MIALDNGDKIRGDSSAASVVDFTLHGIVGTTVTQLADGQLAATIGDLYTAGSAGIAVISIVLVNTDTVARTVNLYLTPGGGTARRLIPKDLSLGAGYKLELNASGCKVIDTSGNILTSNASMLDNTAGGTDGEVTKAPTSNVMYDHGAAADPHTGYRLESADHSHQSAGAQAGQLDHGLALSGLTDDDHTQYRLESADHSHQSTGAQGGKLDHGLALDGLTDDDHTQYRLESADHTHQSTGAEAGQLDHGLALTGLTDDDHTQYQKEDLLTTQGDIPYATAASTWARLPKGTASQVLTMNAGATAPEWAAAGGGGYTQGARAYHNANQSIPNATSTALALNSERYDTDTIHNTATNNSRLTCNTAGKYIIWGGVAWSNVAGGDRYLWIRLNGTTEIGFMGIPRRTDNGLQVVVSTIYELALNDYVELVVFQDTGGAVNLVATANYSPEFAMQRIG